MKLPDPWTHADADGARLQISPTASSPGVIMADNGQAVIVRPHELARLVRVMYAACGLGAPELPHIPDPAQHVELARAVVAARRVHAGPFGDIDHQDRENELARKIAADLLAAGWSKPATDGG